MEDMESLIKDNWTRSKTLCMGFLNIFLRKKEMLDIREIRGLFSGNSSLIFLGFSSVNL
ncbi:MAG: hypothetical protein K0R34_3023 [Herbinix sp.]|jgi:hypothetical protein|nr:hypothetical protein [Herbinix sp.]